MKQKCVFFHTEKGIEDVKELFLKNNIDIVFKSNNCSVDFTDLTNEEKISYFKKGAQQIKQSLIKTQEVIKKISSDLEKIQKIQQAYETAGIDESDLDSIQRYEIQAQRLESRLFMLGKFRRSFIVNRMLHSNIDIDGKLDCGIIIGSIDGNIVRFLEFYDNDDPIITITGNTANALKSHLQRQF